MGFGADIQTNVEKDIGSILKNILPEDLQKFGLIPEFVGRVPIIVTLHQLEEEALIRILTEPRNALTRQYKSCSKWTASSSNSTMRRLYP